MCRLCHLFSPSRAQLLSHCSALHSEQQPPDDIIVALRPLAGDPAEAPAGNARTLCMIYVYIKKKTIKMEKTAHSFYFVVNINAFTNLGMR